VPDGGASQRAVLAGLAPAMTDMFAIEVETLQAEIRSTIWRTKVTIRPPGDINSVMTEK